MAIAGNSSDLSLVDLVQANVLVRNMCRITVAGPAGSGVLYLAEGTVVHAAYADFEGRDAFFALVGAGDLFFQVETGFKAPRRSVHEKWENLALEAMHLKDEGKLPLALAAPATPVRTLAAAAPAPATRISILPQETALSPAPFPARPSPPPRAGRASNRLPLFGGLAAFALIAAAGGYFALAQRSTEETSATAANMASPAPPIEASELTQSGDERPLLLRGTPPPCLCPTWPCVPPSFVASSSAMKATCSRRRCTTHDSISRSSKKRRLKRCRPTASNLHLVTLRQYPCGSIGPCYLNSRAPMRGRREPMPRLIAAVVATAVVAAPAVSAETVRIKGSDTIGGALAPDLGTAFTKQHQEVKVVVEALGSGTAFVGLLDGSADLGASSRPASQKELEQAAARGVMLREYVLGYDGVAVIVHPANPLNFLTGAEISDLFTGKVRRWNELGGEGRAVRRISRPSYSGTHAFFKEKALRKGNSKGVEEFAPDTQFMEDNHDILAAVAGDAAAVAYVGLGWLDARVKALAVTPTAGQPAVRPHLDTIRNGVCPLYRPLLLYTRGEPAGSARLFLQFVLSDAGRAIVSAHGFVPSDVEVALGEAAIGAAQQVPPERNTYRLFFPTGGAILSEEARKTLRAVAGGARGGAFRVLVVGHADARGPATANQRVAQARAAAAAAFLRELGVPSTSIVIEHRAAEEPAATNETPAGRAANRRVDVTLVRQDS